MTDSIEKPIVDRVAGTVLPANYWKLLDELHLEGVDFHPENIEPIGIEPDMRRS
jgi:hypothetical protein